MGNISGRDKVDTRMAEWNKLHFNQAEETPFARGECERIINVRNKDNKINKILSMIPFLFYTKNLINVFNYLKVF